MNINRTHANVGGFLRRIKFVLVNNRVAREDEDCALCGSRIEKGYVRKSRTRLFYRDMQCFARHASAIKPRTRKAS